MGPGGAACPGEVVRQANELWGVGLVVISGGEPLAYRSEGKDVLDLIEKHPDCLYLMYTNRTMIDENQALGAPARSSTRGCACRIRCGLRFYRLGPAATASLGRS